MSGKKYGFLGPRGTYTEEALSKVVEGAKVDLVPYPTEADVIWAVERGELHKGVVPIENSIEGSVNVTLDTLAFEANLTIEREVVLNVRHHLIMRDKLPIDKVKKVISHPQATAQCRKFLAENLPGAEIEAANSTAEAVRQASLTDEPVAAIGPKLAAEIYGLRIAAEGIEDFQKNKTRFVLLGREHPGPTGEDKTSIVCFIYEDRPGSLLQILQEFAYRYINLTKIQSRPTRKALGDYCFFIDLEGHQSDQNVVSALNCLRCKIREIKVLGSYPRANENEV